MCLCREKKKKKKHHAGLPLFWDTGITQRSARAAQVVEGAEITILLALMHPIRELCAGLAQAEGPGDRECRNTDILIKMGEEVERENTCRMERSEREDGRKVNT